MDLPRISNGLSGLSPEWAQLKKRGNNRPGAVGDRIDRVAAVCYGTSPRGLEFLLVKTKGGDRWTFPKGRVEKGEELHRAAGREAAEEAGVVGAVERDPLTIYEYPGPHGPLLVAAFLLKVKSMGPSDESFRSPAWVSPEEAKRRLAQRRKDRYAEEGHRVIEAAVEAIGAEGPG